MVSKVHCQNTKSVKFDKFPYLHGCVIDHNNVFLGDNMQFVQGFLHALLCKII